MDSNHCLAEEGGPTETRGVGRPAGRAKWQRRRRQRWQSRAAPTTHLQQERAALAGLRIVGQHGRLLGSRHSQGGAARQPDEEDRKQAVSGAGESSGGERRRGLQVSPELAGGPAALCLRSQHLHGPDGAPGAPAAQGLGERERRGVVAALCCCCLCRRGESALQVQTSRKGVGPCSVPPRRAAAAAEHVCGRPPLRRTHAAFSKRAALSITHCYRAWVMDAGSWRLVLHAESLSPPADWMPHSMRRFMPPRAQPRRQPHRLAVPCSAGCSGTGVPCSSLQALGAGLEQPWTASWRERARSRPRDRSRVGARGAVEAPAARSCGEAPLITFMGVS